MGLVWKLDKEAHGIRIGYTGEWLYKLMLVSADSMVPFAFFSNEKAKIPGNRSYPRSFSPGFTLGGETDSKPFAGGRQEAAIVRAMEICEHVGDGTLPIPLSDIAIMSKRQVCGLVVAKSKYKYLRPMGGALPEGKDKTEWPAYGYPMLCVMGPEGNKVFPRHDSQGEWRVVQCVFGAVLTREIRARGIGIEVVSREGFGSLFPTLADLPNGVRLDPGLLPLVDGAAAILSALDVVNAFIGDMQQYKKLPDYVDGLNGYDSKPLAGVDRLMSVLHNFTLKSPKAEATDYAKKIMSHNGAAEKCWLTKPDKEVDAFCSIDGVVPNWRKLARKTEPEDSGYGSESDYEDEEGDDEREKKEKIRLDEVVAVHGKFAVKKISVISGMAALRMATFYAAQLSGELFGHFTKTESHSVSSWAPYFELDGEKLLKLAVGGTKAGKARVLIIDGAPNPINIPEKSLKLETNLGAVVIDTTNNTSQEKAQYLAFFQKYLVQPEESRGLGGLLLMIDSASKHPTGGDLVHGVMRVCGSRKLVDFFLKEKLLKHIQRDDYKAWGQTVLSTKTETPARRTMLEYRLVMRNNDLWQWMKRKKK